MKSQQAKRNYVIAEIKRLTQAGIAISKIAKLLDIEYKLACRLQDLAWVVQSYWRTWPC